MKSSKLFAAAAVVLLAAACGKNTQIEGTLHEGAGKAVTVKLLDVNRFQVLDTVKTDNKGAFRYKLDIAQGKPEFIYLFYGEKQIASLLLQKGDKVHVETDTLGVYSVEGSEESLKLQQVEKDYSAFMREMQRILDRSANPDPELSRCYIQYYRDRLKYVVTNSHSLTVVPVLFQQVNPGLPVFGQNTDGLVMRSVADTLKQAYPESRYVKALEKEAARRENQLSMAYRIMNAETLGYPDLELPDQYGKKVKLSEVDAKVVMLYFWTAADATHKMQNLDVLKPVYQDFHNKGFEIYAISLDTDKAVWARAVENQKLPWINVCDGLGVGSPSIRTYNVQQVPSAFFLVDGELKVRPWKNESTLRSAVSDLLK